MDLLKLGDILQAITDIEDYKTSDLQNKMTLHAVLYNVAIIGEAAINMRNRIVHDYGNINIKTVQEVMDSDLPALKLKIETMVKKLEKKIS